MPKSSIPSDLLRAFLQKERVATLAELKRVLNTTATMTVFRNLKALEYLSSYSHRGKYYTLWEIPDFDEQGLWNWHSVGFSRYGNLVETAREFVEDSDSGFTAQELESLLHVECKRALLMLVRQERLARVNIGGRYVYLSKERSKQNTQERLRKLHSAQADLIPPRVEALSHEVRAAIILFFSLLDERQRRLYAGLEAQKFGHGGDRKIADLLDLDMHTVARGRRELFSGDLDRQRIRRPGGGRKPLKKKYQRSSRRSND
jgi:hypothetical protein